MTMKNDATRKTLRKKLTLNKETIRDLSPNKTSVVHGGVRGSDQCPSRYEPGNGGCNSGATVCK
jgi:hypothetical protein